MPTKSQARTALQNHVKAMAHPLRCDIWQILFERVASPKEMSDELGVHTSNISHHTKALVGFGKAELVDTRPVRGTVEHFYRATEPMLLDDSEWEDLVEANPRLSEFIFARHTNTFLADLFAAVKAGTIGKDGDFLVERNPQVVDAEGQRELLDLFDRVMLNDVVEIVQRSAERRSESGDDAIPVTLLLSVFRTPAR